MTIRTHLNAVKWARVSALVFSVFCTTGEAWAQLTVTDQRVSLSYPTGHWAPYYPQAALVGTEPDPAHGIVRAMGWWYRLQGDTREQGLPSPDFPLYGNGQMLLVWENLRGSGLYVQEGNVVIDGEGPSGAVYASLRITNQSAVPQTFEAFHFVYGEWYETRRYYYVEPLSNQYLKFTNTTDPDAVVRYRADGASKFQADQNCSLYSRLWDQGKTELANTAPNSAANSDMCAAFQFTFTIPPGEQRTAYISLSSRLRGDHVKAAFRNLTPHPGFLTCNSNPCTQNPVHWFFKRTKWMGEQKPWSVWPGYRFGGVDDFDGDAVDEAVMHNPTTGEIRIRGMKVDALLYGSWVLRSTGDFNGDGKADLLFQWIGRPGAGRDWSPLRIWLMNGPQLIASVTPDDANFVLESGWVIAGSADFNDDGYTDILFHNQSANDLMIWRMVGTVLVAITFPTPAKGEGSSWRVAAVGDFGAGSTRGLEVAGAPDIVWQDELTGQIVVWYMNFAEQRTSRTVLPAQNAAIATSFIVGPR